MGKILKGDLRNIERPARYVGGEYGKSEKNTKDIKHSIALCYPGIYEDGMSNFIFKRLYTYLNNDPEIFAERVFAPSIDFEKLLINKKERIYKLETKEELSTSNTIIFVIDDVLQFTNILNILKLGNIENLKAKRNITSCKIIAILDNVKNKEIFSNIFDEIFTYGGTESLIKIKEYIGACHICGTKSSNKKNLDKEQKEKLEREGYIVNIVSPISIKDSSIQITKEIFDGFESELILRIIKENIKAQGINKVTFYLDGEVNETKLSKLVFMVNKELPKVRLILGNLDFMRISNDVIKAILPCFEKSQVRFNIVSANYNIRKKYIGEINKEDIIEKILKVVNLGYMNVKLEYVVGFDGETYADIDETINIANELIDIFAEFRAREKININICYDYPKGKKISINKYHKIEMKYMYLMDKKLGSRISINATFPKIYNLENILLNGNENTYDMVYNAYIRGARFDYDDKIFDTDIWDSVIAEYKVNKN